MTYLQLRQRDPLSESAPVIRPWSCSMMQVLRGGARSKPEHVGNYNAGKERAQQRQTGHAGHRPGACKGEAAAVLSSSAQLNNDIVAARSSEDSAGLSALIKERHRDFNTVNLVTAWRALLQMIPGEKTPAESAATSQSGLTDERSATSESVWRADKSAGSDLERSARTALKQGHYAEAAELAHRAMLAFLEAGRKGFKRADQLAKHSLNLHERSLALLASPGNTSDHMRNSSAATAHCNSSAAAAAFASNGQGRGPFFFFACACRSLRHECAICSASTAPMGASNVCR